MSEYNISICRYIINSVLHLICRSFCFWINSPFVLQIAAIQKICATQNYNGNHHHHNSTHNLSPRLSLNIEYIKNALVIQRIIKAEIFFINYLMFYYFFYKNSRSILYMIDNFTLMFLWNFSIKRIKRKNGNEQI